MRAGCGGVSVRFSKGLRAVGSSLLPAVCSERCWAALCGAARWGCCGHPPGEGRAGSGEGRAVAVDASPRVEAGGAPLCPGLRRPEGRAAAGPARGLASPGPQLCPPLPRLSPAAPPSAWLLLGRP